jgi:glycerol uptake facilitator-like aquaporin
MDPEAFNQTVAAVLLGNFLTFLFVFSLWRLGRNQNDMKAYAMFFVVCGVVLLFVYASAT